MPHSKDSQTRSRRASGSKQPDGSGRADNSSQKQGKSPKSPSGRPQSKDRDKTKKGGTRVKGNETNNNDNRNQSATSEDMAARGREWEPYHSLDGWDPMEDDFNSPVFNRYSRPSVEDLAKNFRGHDQARKSDAFNGLQVYVTGIPASMDEKGLKNLFSSAGSVRRVKLCVNRGKKPGCFGFVTMNSFRDVHQAIRKLDGYSITDDTCLRVQIAHVKRSAASQYGGFEDPSHYPRDFGYPLGGVKRQGYFKSVEEGPYYDNIDSRGLYCDGDDDREIMESFGGELKVHVRRSNSREYENGGTSERRRDRGGQIGRTGGVRGSGHRSADDSGRSSQGEENSEDSYDGEVRGHGSKATGKSKPKKEHKMSSPEANTSRDFSQLLASPEGQLLQQQFLSLAMAAFSPFRLNMPPSIAAPSALLTPTNMSLFASQLQQQQHPTATVEDITSPEVTAKKKPDEKMTNGRQTATQSSSSDDQKQPSEQSRDMMPSEGSKASLKGQPQMETKSKLSDQEKKKEKSSEVRLCLNCGQPGKKKCSICQSPYCSAQCQRDHWPKHQHECKKLKADHAVAKATKGSSPTPPKSSKKPYDGIQVSAKDVKKAKPSKKEMKVTVPYSQSPSHFWVQLLLEENISGYVRMQEVMTETFNNPEIEFLPVKPEVGHLYVCFSESNDEWYRCVVLERPLGDKVHVQYVDYGDDDEIPVKSIRLLNKVMTELPLQGLNCTLKGISPGLGEWSKEACKTFFELANGGADKPLTVNFLQPKEGDKKAFISKMIDDEGMDVIGQLLRAGFAKKDETTKSKSELSSPQGVKPKGKPTSPLDGSAKAATASPPQATTKAATPPRQMTTPKVDLPPPVWTTLKESGIIVIEVSGIVNHGGKFYAYKHESSAAMTQLQEDLQACYHESSSEPNDRFQPGDYLVSCYSVDDSWYRARVMESNPSTLKVFFIDYGAEEEKRPNDCRRMEPEFRLLAPQCITMCLHGVTEKDGLPSLGEEFSHWVNGKSACKAEVKQISEGGIVSVRLCALADPKDCLNEKLREKGYMCVADPGPGGDSGPPAAVRDGARSHVENYSFSDTKNTRDSEGTSDERVFVMEVKSPASFWACFAKDDSKMKALEQEMQLHYDKPTGFRPKVGQKCVAQFCQVWYRAVVTSKHKSQDDLFEVLFVDYGNRSEVTSDQCRALLPEHDVLPPFCHHFQLENLADGEGEKYVGKFSEWLEIAEGQVMVRVTRTGDERKLVRIWRPSDEEDCFNDLIGEAPPKLPLPKQTFAKSVVIGDIIDMLVLGKQDNPYLFYAVSVSEAETVTSLEKELSSESNQKEDHKKYLPKEGHICLAKFEEEFYRAHVDSVSGSKVHVLFIDYGNDATVDVSECRSLPKKFLSKPMVAHCCRLDGISEMSAEDLDAFKANVGRCSLQVTRKDGDVLVGIMWPHENPEKPFNGIATKVRPSEVVQASKPESLDVRDLHSEPQNISKNRTEVSAPAEPSRSKSDKPGHTVTKKGSPPKNSLTRPSQQGAKQKQHQQETKGLQKSQKGTRNVNFIRAADIPKPCLPRVGKLLPASLVSLETPSEMYLQLYVMETLKTLKAIVDDEASKKTIDSMTSYCPQVGELCMAYVINQWCRAEVLEVSGSQFNLAVLDYGCTISLGSELLRPAQPSLVNHSLLCLKCSLFGVQPLGGKPWSASAVDFTKKQLQVTETVVQLKVMDVVDGVLAVEIYLQPESEHPQALSEKLITHGLAKHTAGSAGPVVAIPYPLDNTEIQVIVSGVLNPGDFYCEIASKEGIDLVRYLMTAVSEYAEAQVPNPDYKPSVNTFCLGKFKVDDGWYRARILAIEGDRFRVQYIDFGNYDLVSSEELLPLPDQFVDISALAFPCSLAGVSKSSSKALEAAWDGKAAEALAELTQSSALKATVVLTKNDSTEVKLTVLETGEDIGEKLLEMFSNGSEDVPGEPRPLESPPPTEENAAPSTADSTSPSVDSDVQSELERLRAELAAKSRENQELKKMLKK